jgi:hypothetical protein
VWVASRYGGDRVEVTFDFEVARDEIRMVSLIFASWNRLDGWLSQIDALRQVA